MDVHEWRQRVGEPVAARRRELGLSVRQAARRAGISESQWRQVEAGQRPVKGGAYEPVAPKDETLAAMSAGLGWDPGAGINMLIEGRPPRHLVPGQVPTSAMLRPHDRPNLEVRLAQVEDEVRTLMRIVLQIQNDRLTDEQHDSPASPATTRSAP
jgi:transcriptional regulator with XRE-family HTH domain